jgi:hypothetical protein
MNTRRVPVPEENTRRVPVPLENPLPVLVPVENTIHHCFGGRSLKAAELDCCSDCIYCFKESNIKRYDGKSSKKILKT